MSYLLGKQKERVSRGEPYMKDGGDTAYVLCQI